MTVDNKTPLLNIPLPDIQNKLSDDVGRIQSALNLIDQLIDSKASKTELAAAVTAAITDLIDSSPAALDTLNELAAALGDDPNFATTMATQLGLKLDKASYTAADVLAKILTVHGSGSGLDADKLDGMHASAFATAAHVHSTATQSADGFMSSADKTKLDGVAATYLPLSGGTMTGDLSLKGDATQALHPVTLQQFQSLLAGLKPKTSVKAATTANITLSGAQTVDGVALVAGDRVLVKNQTTASQNGIYIVAAGAWTRATDADAWLELVAALVVVEQGTVNADCGWVCTADQGGTLGTTAVTWTQFFGPGAVTAGTGISVSGTQVSLAALTDSGTGSLLKLTRDAYGRVSGTAAVTAADIKGLSGLFGSVAGAALATTGSAGTSTTPAREDHAHPKPTPADIGAQPSDADLTAIAALTDTSGLLRKTAANTWVLDVKTPDGYMARAVEDAPAGTTPRVLVIRDSEVLSNALFRISGVLVADTNVYFPDIMRRPIMVENDTSGNYKLTIVSDGPAAVEIPTGKKAIIHIRSIGVFLSNTYFGPNAKADIGLGNADNTADLDKPVSNATRDWVESLSGKNSVRVATADVLGGVTYATQTITARTTLAATGTTTSGSTSISAVSNAIYYVKVGATISGAGIPAGATVTAVASSTITISAAATATGTSVALTITNPLSALVVDGITLAVGNRVLVKNESASKNGLYTLTTLGTASVAWVLTRTTDGDAWDDLVGAQVAVEEGTTNAETSWLCTANSGGTLGSTSLPWQLVSNSKLASLGNTTLAVGDTIYASGTTSLTKLAGNTTTTRKFMRQTGTGSASAAPTWDTLTLADLPSWQTSIGGIASFSSGGFQIVDNQTSNSTASVNTGFIGISENSGQSAVWLDKWGFTCNLSGISGENLFMGSPRQGWGDGFQALNGANVAALNSSGLRFSNTVDNSAAHTLSWYETGTYTPVLKGGTTAGTFTYSTQLGRYTRIGRMVYIDVNVTVTGASVAPAGNLYITLPKTAISDANKLSQAAAITNNLTITGQAFVQTQSGSVNASVLAVNNGASTAVVSSSDTAFTIQFSLAYVAA